MANTPPTTSVTTPSIKSLSNDLMSVLKKAVTKHTTIANLPNTCSLLQDNINGVDGMALIPKGKGFKMYHLCIKSGFSRGLGTKVIIHLTEYVSATHNSLESIGSFFDGMTQLYDQVQQTKGCSIGETAQKSSILEGLCPGAYSNILGTWVKKILISQGRLTLATATLSDLQHGATDLLAMSIHYKGNALLAGKPPCPPGASARAATTSRGDSCDDNKSSSSTGQLDSLLKCISNDHALNQSQPAWLRQRYKCVHCFSNAHTLDDCRAASSKWIIKAIPGIPAPPEGGKLLSRCHAAATPEALNEQVAPPPTPIPNKSASSEKASRIAATSGEDKTSDSETNKSEEAFPWL
jgi:hypothetical protein